MDPVEGRQLTTRDRQRQNAPRHGVGGPAAASARGALRRASPEAFGEGGKPDSTNAPSAIHENPCDAGRPPATCDHDDRVAIVRVSLPSAAAHTRPPGPRGLPGLGMLLAVRRNPTGVFLDAARRYGDVAYLKIASRHGYLITNPRDVRHVLQDNARNYHKSPLYDKLRTSIGNGLLTSEDDFWLRQRRIAQPAFHRPRIAALAGVMAQAAREAAAHWDALAAAGRPVDIA